MARTRARGHGPGEGHAQRTGAMDRREGQAGRDRRKGRAQRVQGRRNARERKAGGKGTAGAGWGAEDSPPAASAPRRRARASLTGLHRYCGCIITAASSPAPRRGSWPWLMAGPAPPRNALPRASARRIARPPPWHMAVAHGRSRAASPAPLRASSPGPHRRCRTATPLPRTPARRNARPSAPHRPRASLSAMPDSGKQVARCPVASCQRPIARLVL